MTVTLQTRISCPGCSRKIGYTTVATVRVNKRSMRSTGVMIGWLEDSPCPGCGELLPKDRPLDREPYALVPADAEKVAAYRLVKWGIESSGADTERVST